MKCPYCQTEIIAFATVCRGCGAEKVPSGRTIKDRFLSFLAGIILAGLCYFIVGFTSGIISFIVLFFGLIGLIGAIVQPFGGSSKWVR